MAEPMQQMADAGSAAVSARHPMAMLASSSHSDLSPAPAPQQFAERPNSSELNQHGTSAEVEPELVAAFGENQPGQQARQKKRRGKGATIQGKAVDLLVQGIADTSPDICVPGKGRVLRWDDVTTYVNKNHDENVSKATLQQYWTGNQAALKARIATRQADAAGEQQMANAGAAAVCVLLCAAEPGARRACACQDDQARHREVPRYVSAAAARLTGGGFSHTASLFRQYRCSIVRTPSCCCW